MEASVRFDRSTGFFSSAALAIAAAGIVRLIGNGGKMRLLCGAQLSEDDVEAIRKGTELGEVVGKAMVGCLSDPEDRSLKARLEALAWMVANERLEIKVVLPKGKDGLPLPASEARGYYHPKEGIFEDAEGNKLAFSGSANDSQNGWQWNYEVFMVYATWALGGPAEGFSPLPLTPYVAQVERRFERVWQGKEESWSAIEIPEAARRKLLSYCPAVAPTVDPLEGPSALKPSEAKQTQDALLKKAQREESLIFQFLREVPLLPNAQQLGTETSNVSPWPHQMRMVREVTRRFPERFLFCDEVGLEKTIEAGLVLRQLIISGLVKRALLLVPKSVLRQWQSGWYHRSGLL